MILSTETAGLAQESSASLSSETEAFGSVSVPDPETSGLVTKVSVTAVR
jgi:hypothetical protein